MSQTLQVAIIPRIIKLPQIRTVLLVAATWFMNAIMNMLIHFSVGDFFTVLGSILTSAVSGYALYDIHLKVTWKHKKMKEEQEEYERNNKSAKDQDNEEHQTNG